ncbi:Calcium-dependent protein kinase [Trifolium repens]|nr:Calcium-dependent protein kinase [Trifolium repens]
MVVFKWRDGRAYISDGRWVSNKNGITHPRTVHLYFEGVHNRFSMYPVRMSALTNTVMPPPPIKCGRSIWALRPMTYFRTTIDPKKERIRVCPEFMRRFETIIDITKPVFIKYHNNVEYKAMFNFTDDTWYFTNGSLAAEHFRIKVPAVVYLDYQFHDNNFNMTKGKPNTIVNRIAEQKLISLSSDSDDDNDGESLDEGIGDDEDDGSDDEGNDDQTGGESDDEMTMYDDHEDDDLYEFDVKVTEAMAYTKQVLHFPNNTSKEVLGKKQSYIYLRDLDTEYLTKCTVKTSKRNPNEKYIGDGWYAFKLRKNLRPNDVMHFQIERPPKFMNVKVVRGAAPDQ